MGQLTWRNVDAPDLRTSLEGIRTFNDMLGNAFAGAKQGINEFDNGITKRTNQGVLLDIAAAQDTEAAKQLLASMSARPDARRISADTLALGMARPGDLTKQAAGEFGLETAKYTQSRVVDENANLDAARPALARLLGAAGDENAQRQILSESPELQKLTPNQLFDFAGKGMDQTKDMVGLTGERLDQDRTRVGIEGDKVGVDRARVGLSADKFGLMVNQRNDADDQAGQQIAMIAARGGGTAEDVRALIAAQNPTAGQFTSAMKYLDSRFPGVYGPISGSEAGGSWAENVGLVGSESGGNWGALNKEGYGGRLQFGSARLADAAKAGVIPKGMTGAQFSKLAPSDQLKVEEWHFQDIDKQASRNGLDKYIGSTVAGVPINQNSIRGMSHLGGIGGVKRFIESGGRDNPADSNGTRLSDYGRKFGNSRASALMGGSVAARAQLGQRQSQDQSTGITADWDRIVASRRTPEQVASDLAAGELKGIETKDQIRYRIEKGMERSGNNAESVGEVLRRGVKTVQGSSGIIEDLGNMFKLQRGSTPSGLKPVIDNRTIDAQINALGNGGTLDQVLRGADRSMLDGQIQAGQQAVAQSQQLLAAARARAASDPAARLTLPQYERKAVQAQAALTAALREANSKGNRPNNPTTVDAQASQSVGGWLGWLGLKK